MMLTNETFTNDWSDLEDDAAFNAKRHEPRAHHGPQSVNGIDEAAGEYVELCDKCKGTGKWIGGYVNHTVRQCFACKGKGRFIRRTSPEQRAKAKQRYADTKARNAENTLDMAKEWARQHPDQAAWIKTSRHNGFSFAQAMCDTLIKYGGLTEKQQETVDRLTQQSKERHINRESQAQEVDMVKIEQAFESAKAQGRNEQLKVHLGVFTFSYAPKSGVNAGAIYVKQDETYLGKIINAKFHPKGEMAQETLMSLCETCNDPKAAAIAFGRRTGRCSCCGRKLTNKQSVDLGIGPVCAERWGW